MSSITTLPFYDLEAHKPFAIYRIEEHHSVDYFAAHRHTFYEIIWISEGDGTHSIDFVEHPIRLTRAAHAPLARLIALMEEEYGQRDADSDILRALLTTFLLYAARIKTSGRRQTGVRIQERVAHVLTCRT